MTSTIAEFNRLPCEHHSLHTSVLVLALVLQPFHVGDQTLAVPHDLELITSPCQCLRLEENQMSDVIKIDFQP